MPFTQILWNLYGKLYYNEVGAAHENIVVILISPAKYGAWYHDQENRNRLL